MASSKTKNTKNIASSKRANPEEDEVVKKAKVSEPEVSGDRPVNSTMPTDYSFLEDPAEVKDCPEKEKIIKLCSYNVASIKSAAKKGLLEYISAENPTILCLQETKLQTPPKADEYISTEQYPHQFWWCSTAKKGYSGTAILSKVEPVSHAYGFKASPDLDDEGRVITLEFSDFYLVAAYVPNAGDKLVRLSYRLDWDLAMLQHLDSLESTGKPVVYTGDLNVAHHPIDLTNPKTNLKSAGFTIEERNSFTNQLNGGESAKFPRVDVDRHYHPDEPKRYTYYSYRFGARGKGIGWRLDYFVISKSFLSSTVASEIRFPCYGASDHVPLVLWFKSAAAAMISSGPSTKSKTAADCPPSKKGQSSITSFFKPKAT